MQQQILNQQVQTADDRPLHRQRELQLMAERISADVKRCGYSVIDNLTPEEYEIVGANLGSIIEREEIKIVPDSSIFAWSAKAIPLHNDGPEGAVIGLYCLKAQTKQNVGTAVVDVSKLLEELPTDVIEYLKSCTFTRAKGRVGLEKDFTVLTTTEDNFILYFVPWNHPIPRNEQEMRCLKAFMSYIEKKTRDTLINVTLNEGQALFFDNHHYLHGRGPLTEQSERWMKRLWIDPRR